MSKPLTGASLIIWWGALSLAAQVIILREFLTLAQGNELYLGLGLWAWLVWTGLGSLAGGWLAAGRQISSGVLIWLLFGLSASLPLTMIACRALPTIMGWTSGVTLSPASLGLWFVVLCLLYCFLSGLFFPLACKWQEGAGGSAGLVGRVYGLDSLGMCLGGIILQVLLLGRVGSLKLALGAALAVVLSILAWSYSTYRRDRHLLTLIAVVLAGGAVVAAWHLDRASRRWQWPHRTVRAVVETPYSLWSATQEAEQISFSANGLWFFSYPDPETAEEQVHYALLQHPAPVRVLLVGGGVAGLTSEILKTPGLSQVDYVELDPQLIALASQMLPGAVLQPRQDRRLRVIYEDGRRFLQRGQSLYDVIILALPEPKNALLNRFYSLEFFQAVKERLTPQGVFSFGLTGSETSLSPLRTRYLALSAATLGQVFPEVIVLPGRTWRFFASPQSHNLTSDPEILLSRRQARGLELFFVRDYYLRANLSPARRAYANRMLQMVPPEINTDLKPAGLLYQLALGGMEEPGPLPEVLLWLKQHGVWWLYAGVGLITLGGWGRLRIAGRQSRQGVYLYSVLVMGLTAMGMELVVLILFQITLGYLYGQISLLLAAFMGGLAGGSYQAGQRLALGASAWRLAILNQAGLGVFLTTLGLGLPALVAFAPLRQDGWGQAIFVGLLFGAGLLSGAVFASQAELSQRHGVKLSLGAGRLYAVDLAGATLGTLGMSLLVIPCFGPAQALLLSGAMNASAVLLLVAERRRAL
ncbi:MAG TPA: hypothetical protein DCY27_07905 [Desulfobacterales bacterium]|nr:hypothetical protein [Desulfobacterales bacterium]